MSAIVHRLKTIARDSVRIVTGTVGIISDARKSDNIPLSLSVFSCDNRMVKPGKESKYRVDLANNSGQQRLIRLLIDIYCDDNPILPDSQYAYFSATVLLPKKQSIQLNITYNWNEAVGVVIEGIHLKPSEFWRGKCNKSGNYNVYAYLYDHSQKEIEKLLIVQQLTV